MKNTTQQPLKHICIGPIDKKGKFGLNGFIDSVLKYSGSICELWYFFAMYIDMILIVIVYQLDWSTETGQ